MEKTLQVLPTTKTNSGDNTFDNDGDDHHQTDMFADARVTILRSSETDDAFDSDDSSDNSMTASTDTHVDDHADASASDATTSNLDGAADDAQPEYSMGKFTFADEIELATPGPVKLDADPELMKSLASVPQKMAFKIGEVAEMLGVKQYVLRYWETEFEALRPKKSKNNQRVYTRREVETAMLIKKLLYKDRFSIEGARAAMKQLRGQVKEERNWKAVAQGQHKVADRVKGLINDIRRLHDSLA